jgi:hypothetical protein
MAIEVNHSPPSMPRLRMRGAIPLLPHIPSWPGQRKIYLCLLGVIATGNAKKKKKISSKEITNKGAYFLHFNVPGEKKTREINCKHRQTTQGKQRR